MNRLGNIPGMFKIILAVIFSYNNLIAQDHLSTKDLTVFEEPAVEMMREYLTELVDRQFMVRDSLLSTLRSPDDWDVRSKTIGDSLLSWTGSLPEEIPLNARITGRIEYSDYVLEKVLFESRQGFLVSANLYLPKNYPSPRPAILNVTGHDDMGKAAEKTQQICIAQSKKGFVSLAIDGLGQGERKIYGVRVGMAHQIIGTQAFISGTHLFNFMVWDAIRAIDFLISRNEVDPQSIGITGSSGGGMMSTYILPFDDRIEVAVPVCNPNTWSYRVHANLATDHEQLFFGAFASSIDPRGDPLFTQVPKPLLINATTDDVLNPPLGVWDLSTWLYKSYAAHGVPERFTTSMVTAAHEYNQEQREVTYAWMLRWMADPSVNFLEEIAVTENEEELWASETGSVFSEPESRHPHDWVLDYLKDHQFEEKTIQSQGALENFKIEMAKSVKKILNTDFDNITVMGEYKGERSKGDITIRPFVLEPEAGITLPGVILESRTAIFNQELVLYIHQNGKSEILQDLDILKQLLAEGYRICTVDLRGTGETSPDLKDKFWDFLAGKPIFGQRVGDILAITKWLKESETDTKSIKLWGTGMCALYGAFAGVLSDDISDFVLENPLLSFENVVQVGMPEVRNEVMLPGILEEFDMPQIYQALCPRSVVVLNPHLADRTFAEESDMKITNSLVSTTFKAMKQKKEWQMTRVEKQERKRIVMKGLIE